MQELQICGYEEQANPSMMGTTEPAYQSVLTQTLSKLTLTFPQEADTATVISVMK